MSIGPLCYFLTESNFVLIVSIPRDWAQLYNFVCVVFLIPPPHIKQSYMRLLKYIHLQLIRKTVKNKFIKWWYKLTAVAVHLLCILSVSRITASFPSVYLIYFSVNPHCFVGTKPITYLQSVGMGWCMPGQRLYPILLAIRYKKRAFGLCWNNKHYPYNFCCNREGRSRWSLTLPSK